MADPDVIEMLQAGESLSLIGVAYPKSLINAQLDIDVSFVGEE